MARPIPLVRRLMRAAPVLNVPMMALIRLPHIGKLLNHSITMLTYTGRQSGRRYHIPVAYRRHGEKIIINANLPEAKTWWRNFTDDEAPVTLHINGTDRTGHALAKRDANGHVTVTVRLDS